MNRENTEKLFHDFPLLYRGRWLGPERNLMHYGFCCGDGWFDLVYRLSQELTRMAVLHGVQDKLMALQVKEKFGALRFYTTYPSGCLEDIRKLIQAAERKSQRTCERCGAPGQLLRQPHGYFATLCPVCAPKDAVAAEFDDEFE